MDQVGDIGLFGGCEVSPLVGIAERVNADGVSAEVESPLATGGIADDGADGSASVGDFKQPVATSGTVIAWIEDDHRGPAVTSPWGESPFEWGDVLSGGGGFFGFDGGKDVGELVDDGDAFQMLEVFSEPDTDHFEGVGDGTGGEFGGHRVTGGGHLAGVADDLDGAEMFEVQEELAVVVVADGYQGRVGGGGGVGEEV